MKASELNNEELATVIRGMKVTGICPSSFEKECLEEGAKRIEMLETIINRIEKIIEELEGR